MDDVPCDQGLQGKIDGAGYLRGYFSVSKVIFAAS